MSTVNMKELKKLVDAANAAFEKWKPAGTYALTQHAGYSAALKTNKAARDAAAELRGYATSLLTSLQADPQTDPSWFSTVGPIRDKADYQVQTLDSALELVKADLAKNLALSFPPSEASKLGIGPVENAAAAVDGKAKSTDPYPNRKTPEQQDSKEPPADVPPSADEMSTGAKVGLFAAAGLALVWIVRKVM